MQILEAFKTVDFPVFKKVIRGNYNPVNINKAITKSCLSLVRAANTFVVSSSNNKDELTHFVSTLDYTAYGYHSPDDVEISYPYDPDLKVYKAIIKPRFIYQLNEDISLPVPPDKKTKLFMDFFADEFERVKIRAEHSLCSASSDDMLRSMACRNLQLLKKLFKESRFAFISNCSYNNSASNQSDLFIMYILNLFIIRCAVFYSWFYKPYHKEEVLAEIELRKDLHQGIPHILKYPWLFDHRPPLIEIIGGYSNYSASNESEPVYLKNIDLLKSSFPEIPINEALEILKLKNSARLNCNINVFMDFFYQLLNKKTEDGKCYLEVDKTLFCKLLVYSVLDKNKSSLNFKSLIAMLKHSNYSKRPHDNDKKRIKIS